MFKAIQSGFSKFLNKRWIPIIILLVICFVLLSYSSAKGSILDRMTDGNGNMTMTPTSGPTMAAPSMAPPTAHAVSASASPTPSPSSGYVMQPVANPSDLLPKDKNSQWASLNPSSGNVAMPDLLQAGYHIGLDTIGQTLKNANYQLRSDPVIEKTNTGPWLQSTIEPDFMRVPLEVGAGTR